MKTESDKLFVYGSLRRGYALHGHLRRRGARLLGAANVQPRWEAERRYHGAWASRCPLDRVEGELYLLRHPETDLELLDELEEVNPAQPEKSLYERRLSRVLLPTGRRCLAWVYFLPPKPSRRSLVTRSYDSARRLQAAAT